jgi:hypothetical protein
MTAALTVTSRKQHTVGKVATLNVDDARLLLFDHVPRIIDHALIVVLETIGILMSKTSEERTLDANEDSPLKPCCA